MIAEPKIPHKMSVEKYLGPAGGVDRKADTNMRLKPLHAHNAATCCLRSRKQENHKGALDHMRVFPNGGLTCLLPIIRNSTSDGSHSHTLTTSHYWESTCAEQTSVT